MDRLEPSQARDPMSSFAASEPLPAAIAAGVDPKTGYDPRTRALIEGRLAPSTDDVVALAGPVLRHRMALTFPARAEGMTIPSVIERLCRSLL